MNEGLDRVRAFMGEHVSSEGTIVQVVELTGEPRDVVLMDVRHVPAPHCLAVPRLMLAQ
ncbi:MAG TPA: hypothetical protein VKM54_16800 [Myxococcota bacterium]|nr:hypothetical protein [Myxococcota bacterium]